MSERPLIVQFVHPGGEHIPVATNGAVPRSPWNPVTQPHRRKFMTQPGRWVKPRSSRNGTWEQGEGQLMLWGEWEPESELVRELDGGDGLPRYLVRPYWQRRRSYAALHNTDPFVFEEQFKYIICLQNGKMTELPVGSMILFGSRDSKRKGFMVDTVFIVAGSIPYTIETAARDLKNHVSNTYHSISVSPIQSEPACVPRNTMNTGRSTSRRLYFGATVDQPIAGMFSFFPCQVDSGQQRGFARPVIRISDLELDRNGAAMPVIKDTHFKEKRYTFLADPHHVATYWNMIVEQVTAGDLLLGVAAETPDRGR